MSTKKTETADRWLQIMKSLGFKKQSHLAVYLGVSRQFVNDLVNGKKEYKQPVLSAIADKGFNINWFLTGRGPMMREDLPEKIVIQTPQQAHEVGLTLVPTYSVSLSAGAGLFVDEEEQAGITPYPTRDLKQLTPDTQNLVELPIEGESMEPTLYPGQRVLVNVGVGQTIKDGIWALNIDNALLVKRIQRLPGGRLRIISDNPSYAPYEVRDEDLGESVRVVGRVLLGARRF